LTKTQKVKDICTALPYYEYHFKTYVKKSAGRGRTQRQSLSWSTRPTRPWCSLMWRASLRPPVTHSCNHRNTLGKSVNPGALFLLLWLYGIRIPTLAVVLHQLTRYAHVTIATDWVCNLRHAVMATLTQLFFPSLLSIVNRKWQWDNQLLLLLCLGTHF